MKLALVLFITIFTLPLFAQVDLEEQAKGKLKQQDFNTTRSNKERGGNRNPKKKSRTQTEAMPPPPPPAPMPNPEEDSNAIHLEWYQFEFNQQLDYRLINAAPFPRSNLDVKMIYGRTACWVEEKGNSTITIQDFLRSKLFFVDTLAKTVRISSFEAINSTLETHTFKTTGEKKVIDGVNCLEYKDQSADVKEQTVIWVAESLALDVIYQQYRPFIQELGQFHIFVNGKMPVLEQINHSVGQPLNAMKVMNIEEKSILLDLTNYTLIP
jgi:hypothetical protein